MNYIEFESLLGNNISYASSVIGSEFKIIPGGKIYSNNGISLRYYFDIPYNMITLTADTREIVQSVTIHFPLEVDKDFYNFFNEEYGIPDSILIKENRQTIREGSYTNNEGGSFYGRKSTFDLREGTFEEKPLYIIWKRPNFQIRLLFRGQPKTSQITFSLVD